MLFKLLASILTAIMAIAGSAIAEQVTTITETNYYTPSLLKDQIEGFTAGNTLPSGIPVHFVYVEDCAAPAPSTDTTITTVATSSFYYTVSTSATLTSTFIECEADACSSKYSYSQVPTTYSTLAYVTYTTTFCPEADVTEEPVTVAKSTESTVTVSTYAPVTNTVTKCIKGVCSSYESVTSSPTVYVTAEMVEYSTAESTKTRQHGVTVNVSADPITVNKNDLVTTTETIYEASTTPTSIYSGITTTQSLTTKSDPLVTKSPVYSSRSKSITTSFKTGITISSTNSSSLSGSLSSQGSFSTVGSSKLTNLINADPASTTAINPVLPNSQSLSSGYFNRSSSYEPSSSNKLSMTSLLVSSEASGSTSLSGTSTLGASSLSSASESSGSSSSVSKTTSLESVATNGGYAGDLFVAISTDEPSDVFTRDSLPLELPDGVNSDDSPIETNKFWDNLILGSQTDMIWTYPYGMHWSNSNNAQGFALQHTVIGDRVYGSQDTNNVGVDSYYYNPIDITELLISATTFTDSNFMSISNMKSMSVSVQLSASSSDTTNYIEMPLVQGMGFVTSIYHGDLVPEIDSLVGVDSFDQEVISAKNSKRSNILTNILKYRVTLYSGSEWLIYVTLPNSSDDFKLTVSNSNIVGSKSIDGLIIQAVVAPEDSSQEQYYDSSAGMYVTGANVEGSVSGDSAEYKIVYSTEGSSECGTPIVFALPHHVQSLTSACSATALGIQLPSTSKGNMTAFLTNELAMSETLESSISFLPWSQTMTGSLTYTADQLNLIVEAANSELNVDIAATVASLDSTYSSGKVIDKYAYILLVLSDIIGDEEATNTTLSALKDAFAPFLENKQYYPFMYDQRYKGVTSTANNNGDTGADYGSGYYNDHHFHYGYYVHAAAVVGYVDKKLGGTWAEDNKDWVNALIRDVANPSEDDTYFPVSRMFDWFQGHSWAAGLFASGDGKNEESSSEDYNFAYGMKMWGSVIGDGSMESRGSLMLSIMSRAMNMYFYYKSDNDVEPSQILPNKVSGIFFENKVTYTTYFGTPAQNPEYVHGIHMLPITPASSLIRIPSYVEEEWEDQISTFINKVDSGWTGILRLNQALYDASSSYSFFSSDSWSNQYLDDGQSRTWSLAYSAGVMNSS